MALAPQQEQTAEGTNNGEENNGHDYGENVYRHYESSSSYYIVVVFIDPLQGLYAILFGDTVDWFRFPTTRWLQKGSNHSLFVQLLIS